jgi:hypothetical protein
MNSGLVPTCTVTTQTDLNIMGLAYLVVAEANAAFELSKVDNWSMPYRTPDYKEPTDEFAQRTMLRDLARVSDLLLNEVHTQQELYSADLAVRVKTM